MCAFQEYAVEPTSLNHARPTRGIRARGSTGGAYPVIPGSERFSLGSPLAPAVESTPQMTRGTWLFPVVGAAVGLALGILVSVTTDVPFAPEIGLVLGVLVGWLSRGPRT